MSKKIIDKIYTDIEKIVLDAGYDLVDIDFLVENKTRILRIYIDSPKGIGLDDCQKVSHLISDYLDEKDPIETSYQLEVSSSGLDRPLKTEKDYQRNLNNRVEVKLYQKINGEKRITGELVSFSKDQIVLRVLENELPIDISNISKMTREIVF